MVSETVSQEDVPMQNHFRKLTAALLCSAMLCAAAAMTGCNDNNNSQVDTGNSIYSPTVPDSRVDPNEKGEVLTAKVNEAANYKDKVTAKVTKVVELDNSASEKGRVLLAEMEITNTGSDTLDCTVLAHFGAFIGDEKQTDIVSDLAASIFARRYYTTIGSDLQSFNTPIKPGETVNGYVYMRVPKNFDGLQLAYIPYQYYSNDAIRFAITEEDLEHFTQPYAEQKKD